MARSIIEELVAVIGFDIDSNELDRANRGVDDIAKKLGNAAKIATAVGAAIFTMSVRSVTRIDSLAKSVEVSNLFLQNSGNIVKSLGFDYKNVSDLVEEMNNKIGESTALIKAGLDDKPMIAVRESLATLNLEFKELIKLNPEQQFTKILDAASKLDNGQDAVFAVDSLMGGEANKVLGFIRSTGKSFSELVAIQAANNAQTEQGVKDTVKFGLAMSKITSFISNVSKAITGLVAKRLQPFIEKLDELTLKVTKFIRTDMDAFLTNIGVALKVLGGTVGVFIAIFISSMTAAKWALIGLQVSALLIPLAVFAMGASLVLAAQDIFTFISSGGKANTMLGKLMGFLNEFPRMKALHGFFVGLTVSLLELRDSVQLFLQPSFDFIFRKFDQLTAYLNSFKSIGSFFGFDVGEVSQRLTTIDDRVNANAINDATATPFTTENLSSANPNLFSVKPFNANKGQNGTGSQNNKTVTNNITIDATNMNEAEVRKVVDSYSAEALIDAASVGAF